MTFEKKLRAEVENMIRSQIISLAFTNRFQCSCINFLALFLSSLNFGFFSVFCCLFFWILLHLHVSLMCIVRISQNAAFRARDLSIKF